MQFLIVMGIIMVFVYVPHAAQASKLGDTLIPDDTKNIFESSEIPSPPKDLSGQEIVELAVLRGLRYAKIIIGVIGILYITILGYTLVTAADSEEEITTSKRGFVYMFIAFILISMSEEFAKIFDMRDSTLFQSPQEILKRVRLFDRQIEVAVTFIKYVVGAYATLMMVRSGIKLVTSGGEDEEAAKHKKSILYSAGGLVVIFLGDIFINKVFYKIDYNVYSGITGVHPMADAKAGIIQLAGITNFIVSLVGPLAVLMLVVGAILYATAGGEDDRIDKAKRMILTTIIAILIIYGAFALVNTVISGRLQDIGALT